MTSSPPKDNNTFDVIAAAIGGLIVGLLVALLLSSCHPYPFATVKPDKNVKAAFR